ncbi:MAG: DUF6261 family protein [Tannerella sp.]|nr:DUF6261 family protein [Tannerella sp.]
MIKFATLFFKSLPNEAHYRFFDRATSEIAKAGAAVHTALGSLETDLNGWFALETANIEWYRKSALTAAIADADHALDHALVGMAAQVNAARYSADLVVVAAAEHVYIMLKSYGHVAQKPYLQEAGAVKAILLHLNGDLATDAATAGISAWIPEIEGALHQFVSLIEEREAETLGKPEKNFPEVRRGIEGVWHPIVTLVNSGAALNLSEDFAALIRALNPEIDYLNGEFHHAKLNIATAEPAPIGQQTYTGRPCTPLPEVLYVTSGGTIRLELGKDFNVTYKNNVNPGNAECTIHGKGKYKGHRTVTFIIARD